MNNREIIQVLEHAPDLKTNPTRLKDLIEMGQNIFLVEKDFEEGKRICLECRDIALRNTPKRNEYYELYLLSLKYLARYFRDFDSYLIYVEHKREAKDQFYLPRREVLRKLEVTQSLQDLLDDKLDVLSISLATGVGKAQPLYSKVFTPSGFKKMGDIHVGDKVIASNGNEATVLGVFPQGKRPVYEFVLVNGEKVRSSDNHLWKVIQDEKKLSDIDFSKKVVTTDYIIANQSDYNFFIPVFDKNDLYDRDEYGDTPYVLLKSISYVGEEECQCIYISDPSHLYITDDYIITHNTTIEEFFVSYYMGLYPEKYNLFSSHTNSITDMFYRAVLSIISSDEYAWSEIFQNVPIEFKSDKEQQINLGKQKPFKTLSCKSIGSATAGVTRANGLLCCDDLIEGKEEAFSPERLERKYESYSIDLRTRKMEGCKELHICTRWSVHDVIGHLIAMYGDSDRAKFIAVDCYDENGESVFTYKRNGFTTQYFKDLEASMDKVSFQCMFRSNPIEREGLLYNEDELNYYMGGLPCDSDGKTKEADAILGVCDTKDTGDDYNCLLVVHKYGSKCYLDDVVYDNGSPYTLDELNANCLVRNKVQICRFESNKEGSRTGDEVQKLIEQKGGRCTITKKYTTQNKETKIMVNSDWVKKHIVFKDKSEWTKMYREFMDGVFHYVQLGKNKHDDGVDALAMLAIFVTSFEGSQVDIFDRSRLGL